VFYGLIVNRRAAAKKGDSLLFTPWYTSGKFAYSRKSDLPETAIR